MLDKIKKSLRIKHNELDSDIQQNIDACRLDMQRVGVSSTAQDALIEKAVELYCKAQYNFMGKGDQFQERYNNLRDSLSMSTGYKDGE